MIHQYKMNGHNIVLDVESNSVFEVDEIAFDVLELYKQNTEDEILLKLQNSYSKSEIAEAFSEIAGLEKDGLLFSKGCNLEADFEDRQAVVKALCLNVTHDCNLACVYCFADEGVYNGEKSLMSFEVAKKAIDFLIENSGSRKNLEVDFFGGEPLMNFELVKNTVAYARSLESTWNKEFRFTISTNAILLDDEKEQFLNDEMKNIVISIDGRPEVHDKLRPDKAGNGSYTRIIGKAKSFVEKRGDKEYYIRGTFSRLNKDFSKDVQHLASEGFKNISMEPVVSDSGFDFSIQKADIAEICDEYENLAKIILESRKTEAAFNFFHFNIDFSGGPCIYKRISSCGSGSEYLAVSPDGKLYPCHQFVGLSEFVLGDVDCGISNGKLQDELSAINLYKKPECLSCFAKYFCGGGCSANAHKLSGSLYKNDEISCALQKKRLECSIMLFLAK